MAYTRRRRRTSRSGSLRRSSTGRRVSRRRTTARRSSRSRAGSRSRTVRIVVQMAAPTGVAPVGQARQIVRRARF